MKYRLVIPVISLFFFISCDDDDCVTGGGSLNDYQIDVADFNMISVDGPSSIRVTQGNEQSVTIQAEPEVFGIMEQTVKNGELIIDYGNNNCFKSDLGVTINITVPDLRRIEISGTSDISSVGDLNLNELTIEVSGDADVNLTGTVSRQVFDVSGNIEVQNFEFYSEETAIEISGSGELEVSCTEQLDIEVSGAATISYKGNPQIDQDVSGSLTLIDSN